MRSLIRAARATGRAPVPPTTPGASWDDGFVPTSRRSRRHQPARPLDVTRARGGYDVEQAPDGEWSVRRVRSAEKTYTCPGCRQTIPSGTEHVVVWANDHLLGAQAGIDARRHWHVACWRARDRRR